MGLFGKKDNSEKLYQKGKELHSKKKYVEAMRLFMRAAETGHKDSLYMIATCYAAGDGVEENMEKAVQWLHRAAEWGHASAQTSIASYYYEGSKLPKDYEKAIYWYEKAAAQGDKTALGNIGYIYENGIGTEHNYEKAREYYIKAAAAGNSVSAHNLGLIYMLGIGIDTDYDLAEKYLKIALAHGDENAAEWLKTLDEQREKQAAEKAAALEKAAENGDKEAQYELGMSYIVNEYEFDEKNDFDKAVYWLTKAAEQGYASAQRELGKLYDNGEAVDYDAEKAEHWFGLAADNGDVESMYWLGWITIRKGNEENYAKGILLLKYAELAGSALAGEELKERLAIDEREAKYNDPSWDMDSELMPREEAIAVELFNKAVKLHKKGKIKDAIELYAEAGKVGFEHNGYDEAHFELGLIFLGQAGDAYIDFTKAAYRMQKAARLGHLEAQKLLGMLYENGEGVERDMSKALRWYELVAARGDMAMQEIIAKLYRSGEGIARDSEKAFYWYAHMAARDNLDAMRALAQMYEAGEGIPKDVIQAERWRNAAEGKYIHSAV